MARIHAMLDLLMDALKEAVRVVIEFSRSIFKEFTMRHRETLAEYLVTTDNPAKAANVIKAFARPSLNDREFEKGSRELDRSVSNFPAVLEDMNRNRRRGLSGKGCEKGHFVSLLYLEANFQGKNDLYFNSIHTHFHKK